MQTDRSIWWPAAEIGGGAAAQAKSKQAEGLSSDVGKATRGSLTQTPDECVTCITVSCRTHIAICSACSRLTCKTTVSLLKSCCGCAGLRRSALCLAAL
jgi:hypothetical protein